MMQFEQTNIGGKRMSTATQKNPKIKANHMAAGTDRELTEGEAVEKRMTKRMSKPGIFTKVTDRIANDSFFVRNQPIPKGKELFPAEWKMQYADIFYPYALDEKKQRTPLYIDIPGNLYDVALCERKLKVCREKGIRYTYIKADEAEWEGTLRLQGQDPDKIKADQAKLRAQNLEAKA